MAQPKVSDTLGCDHLCDTVTHYDRLACHLICMVVCVECCTEIVVETLAYEPNYLSTPAGTLQSDAGTPGHL